MRAPLSPRARRVLARLARLLRHLHDQPGARALLTGRGDQRARVSALHVLNTAMAHNLRTGDFRLVSDLAHHGYATGLIRQEIAQLAPRPAVVGGPRVPVEVCL